MYASLCDTKFYFQKVVRVALTYLLCPRYNLPSMRLSVAAGSTTSEARRSALSSESGARLKVAQHSFMGNKYLI